MPQSSAPRASTVVKTAALLMAVPALLAPMKVAAQQMAANTPNFSRCDQMSATDPKGAIACRVEVLKAAGIAADARGVAADARGAAADKRIAAVDDSIACAKFLLGKRNEGVALDPTRLNREKGCTYARELGMQ